MSAELFTDPPVVKTRASIDWMNEFARRKLNVPKGWRWVRWTQKGKKPNEFFLVEGAVCNAVYTKGKRKGHINWERRDKATDLEFVVRYSELTALEHEWERETGKCFECFGTGDSWCGWDHKKGNKYKPCKRCNATGIGPSTQSAEKAA